MKSKYRSIALYMDKRDSMSSLPSYWIYSFFIFCASYAVIPVNKINPAEDINNVKLSRLMKNPTTLKMIKTINPTKKIGANLDKLICVVRPITTNAPKYRQVSPKANEISVEVYATPKVENVIPVNTAYTKNIVLTVPTFALNNLEEKAITTPTCATSIIIGNIFPTANQRRKIKPDHKNAYAVTAVTNNPNAIIINVFNVYCSSDEYDDDDWESISKSLFSNIKYLLFSVILY